MNDLVPFSFESAPVRIMDRDGHPWFVLADLCRILGLSNPTKAAAALDDDEKMTLTITEGHSGQRGGAQMQVIVCESAMWKLVLRSRKPEAKRITRWMTSVVMPSIRRTGQYGKPAPAIDVHDPHFMRTLVEQLAEARSEDADRIAELEPQAEALRRIADTEGLLCVTDAAKVLDVQPRKLFAWMEAHGWLFRRTDNGPYVAHGEKLKSGMLKHKGTEIQRYGKPSKLVEQVMVTSKGLARLGVLKAGR